MQLARILVQEERDRHAPAALAADAPVGAAGDHVAQARLAVLRIEAGLVDRGERELAQRGRRLVLGEHADAFVHAHEPLRRGAVDHRRLVAPAVRVAVRDLGGGEQPAGVAQRFDDGLLGLPDELAAEQRQLGRVDAAALHRIEDVVDRHPVADARVEVIDPVRGRRVDDAGAVVGGGVVGQVDRREAVVAGVHFRERMAEADLVERLARRGGEHGAGQAVAIQALLDQRGGEQQQAALGVDQAVFQLRVQVQRLVGGDGPRGGRPDHHEGVLGQRRQAEGRRQLGRLGALEADVDREALLVGVLDLELGQRRAAVEAPVHRLQSAIDEAAFDHALERAQLAGLVGEVHRLVGMLPVAEHAQALEVGHLLADLRGGVGTALGLHVVAAELAAEFLLDRVLDRQAVAIPARRVLRVVAHQLTGLDDHVLQDLVDGVTHVDLAVGVRRPIVQHEQRLAHAGGAQALVAAFLVPLLNPARLALGQVAAHRERGVGEVERGPVVRGGGGLVGVGGHGDGASGGDARKCEAFGSRGRQGDGEVCQGTALLELSKVRARGRRWAQAVASPPIIRSRVA